MTTQHTQGRLKTGTGPHGVLSILEEIDECPVGGAFSLDDARRLVACWNWCEGQETEGLELSIKIGRTAKDFINEAYTKELTLIAQRDELLEALKGVEARCKSSGYVGQDGQYLKTISSTIAKVEGGAA